MRSTQVGAEDLRTLVRTLPVRAIEPTVGVTSLGVIFYATNGPLEGSGRDWTYVVRSRDGGRSWEDATPLLVEGRSFPTHTNDPYLHVDRDTGRVFMSHSQAACSALSFSDDEGESWTSNPVGCGHPVGVHDHQHVFTAKPRLLTTSGYPNLVYYCISRVVDGACATSVDGGLTFGALRPLVWPPVNVDLVERCRGLMGHGVAHPDGSVYVPAGWCGIPSVAVSDDDGLTWQIRAVVPEKRMHENDHEVSIAFDAGGVLHAAWIGLDRRPYLASSADRGKTWSVPIDAGPEGPGSAAFVSLAAGGRGHVVVSYVLTEVEAPYHRMPDEALWHPYLSIVRVSDEGVEVRALRGTEDPVARGACGGRKCVGEGGGIADFLDVTIDPQGRPWATFVDMCAATCAAGSRHDSAAALLLTLARGPSLVNGEPLPPLGGGDDDGSEAAAGARAYGR